MKSANQYTAEELQQLLDMARVREAEAKAQQQSVPRPVKEGSLVKYVDAKGREHTALVLELKDQGVLRLKVFCIVKDEVVEAGPGRWRR